MGTSIDEVAESVCRIGTPVAMTWPRRAVMVVVLALMPLGAALAQAPDALPDEAVRAAQKALRDLGYYDGPLNGLFTLELRRAVWYFQHDRQLLKTSRLDAATLAVLQPEAPLPTTGAPRPSALEAP